MNLPAKNLIIEGKVKKVYQSEKTNEVLINHQDKVTAGNGLYKDCMLGKGNINAKISSIMFKHLEEAGLSTHFIELDESNPWNIMRCKKVDIIPLEVVVRNVAAGSIVRETNIEKGYKFSRPIVEFYLKDDSKNDPLLTQERLSLMGFEERYATSFLKVQALNVNKVIEKVFSNIGLNLIDFKLEFGFDSEGRILIADEITPDGCRLWIKDTEESMDKDLYREEGYNSTIMSLRVITNKYEKIMVDLENDNSWY